MSALLQGFSHIWKEVRTPESGLWCWDASTVVLAQLRLRTSAAQGVLWPAAAVAQHCFRAPELSEPVQRLSEKKCVVTFTSLSKSTLTVPPLSAVLTWEDFGAYTQVRYTLKRGNCHHRYSESCCLVNKGRSRDIRGGFLSMMVEPGHFPILGKYLFIIFNPHMRTSFFNWF